MPNVGSVSSAGWPSVVYAGAWTPTERQGAKVQCCDIACERAQNANPTSALYGGLGQTGGLTPSGTGRKPTNLYSNDNRKKGFRGQAGRETTEDYNLMMSQFSSMSFYQAGRQAAQAAFEAGGVNALLSFLAGFNSGQ